MTHCDCFSQPEQHGSSVFLHIGGCILPVFTKGLQCHLQRAHPVCSLFASLARVSHWVEALLVSPHMMTVPWPLPCLSLHLSLSSAFHQLFSLSFSSVHVILILQNSLIDPFAHFKQFQRSCILWPLPASISTQSAQVPHWAAFDLSLCDYPALHSGMPSPFLSVYQYTVCASQLPIAMPEKS